MATKIIPYTRKKSSDNQLNAVPAHGTDVKVTQSENVHVGTKVLVQGNVNMDILNKWVLGNANNNSILNNKNSNIDNNEEFISKNKIKARKILHKNIYKKYLFILIGCSLFLFIISIIIIILTQYHKISQENIKPKGIINKHHNISFVNDRLEMLNNYVNKLEWDSINTCPISDIFPPKSKIRFVMKKQLLIWCTQLNHTSCTQEFENRNKNTFRDIYFNYIIGGDGRIYQGRSLTCYHNESAIFYPEDHMPIIIIAMGYCFSGTHNSEIKAEREVKASIDLIKIFFETNVITENYTLEFSDECENSTLVKKLEKNNYNISYYQSDIYLDTKECFNMPEFKMDDDWWQRVPYQKRLLSQCWANEIKMNSRKYLKKHNLTTDIYFQPPYGPYSSWYHKKHPEYFTLKKYINYSTWIMNSSVESCPFRDMKNTTVQVIKIDSMSNNKKVCCNSTDSCTIEMNKYINYQMNKNNYSNINFRYVIFGLGYIFEGRSLDCRAENSQSNTVIVGFDDCNVIPQQYTAFYYLISEVMNRIENYSSLYVCDDISLRNETKILLSMAFPIFNEKENTLTKTCNNLFLLEDY